MNRRRNQPTLSRFTILVLLAGAVITAFGAILFACYKNRQVQLAREIEDVEQQIAAHEDEIRTVQMRMDQLLNRYVMRDQLRELGSTMRAIPPGAVEVVADPANPPPHTMATVRP